MHALGVGFITGNGFRDKSQHVFSVWDFLIPKNPKKVVFGVCVSYNYQSVMPGGGGALRYRGGPHLRYVFRGRRSLFLRPPHVRDFVKEGYFFVPRYEVWGSKSP